MHVFKDAFIIVNNSNFWIFFSFVGVVSSHVTHIMTKASNSSNEELKIGEILSDGSWKKSTLHEHEKDGESMCEVVVGKDIVVEGNLSN